CTGLHPGVLAAVHGRVPRHAGAVSRVPAGIPGAERVVVGRRVDPRRRVPDPDGVSDVVAALRPRGGIESMGRRRTRMDDDVAAAEGQFRRDAGRHMGGVRLPRARRRRGRVRELPVSDTETLHPPLPHQFASLEQQVDPSTLGMWVFLVTEVLFFGGLFVTYCVYRSFYPAAFAAASHELDVVLGTTNTIVLITSSL